MNQTDLSELLAEERFSPFVLTTFDGFSLAIGFEERKHMLVGARMLITLDAEGNAIPTLPTSMLLFLQSRSWPVQRAEQRSRMH
jgi:hypothetical protein